MKEATGELSMTAIAVVAIAAIGVLFYTLIWPSIKSSIQTKTQCTQAVCGTCNNGVAACTYIDESGNSNSINCQCS